MTRKDTIKTLKEHKIMFTHDFGWDTSTIKALEIAIKDMEFLNFLANVIPPNEMEKYIDMYKCSSDKNNS